MQEGDRVRFETPEDVALSFDLAGPGSRAAAAIVDYLIIGAVVIALVAALTAAGAIAVEMKDLFDPEALLEMGGLALALLLAVVGGVNLFYFVGAEWFLSGQSVGKRLFGLRVVRDGGYAISFSASLVRNVMRVIDMLPGIYFVGLLSVILSKERRRLGDFVAGTLVVRHAVHEAPKPRFVGERYATLQDRQFALTRDQIGKLGAESLALLDGYFERAERMDAATARALAASIAAGLAKRMSIELQPGDETKANALLKETYLALREHLSI